MNQMELKHCTTCNLRNGSVVSNVVMKAQPSHFQDQFNGYYAETQQFQQYM